MAYSHSQPDPRQPPRRAYTTDESQGQYMHGPGRGPPPPQGHQQYGGDYRQGGGNWGGNQRPDPAVRSQSQRRAPPPQQGDGYGNYGYAAGPTYSDPGYGLENDMRNLNMSPAPMQNRGRGTPDPYMNMNGGRGQRPPPPGWNHGRGESPAPQQRMPPQGMQMRGRGGHAPAPRQPPPPQQQFRAGWNGEQQYDASYAEEYQPIQRSMTMPVAPPEPQYTAYNPAMAGRFDAGPPQDPRSLAPEPQYGPRESVGAFLDSYYTAGPDPYVAELPAMNEDGAGYQAPPQAAIAPKPNFSRPVLENRQPPKVPADPYWSGEPANSDFAQQAHKSRSQPNLRNGGYDGMVGMPPPMPTNGYEVGIHGQGPNGQYPPRKGSYSSTTPSLAPDSLPIHPDPASMRQAERQYSADSLPAHPPPVRPGLMQSDHPPPQRQYDTESNSIASAPPQEPQPVTKVELEQLSQAARTNPGDPKLQLTLAKKMVEAATVLANEGGRADVKTTRKNRENYIFDAHKIVKRLSNASPPYPDAVFYLASCYGEGQLGLQIDHERAYTLYQTAAKLNHGASAYRTAVCCELGAGVRRDPTKAITWYKKAASLGETPAMFKLGMIQWKGLLGQPRNPRDGLIWLKRAADQADENNQHALHELGLLYERTDVGDVIIPDLNYARELFMRAADLGYPASQFRLGCAYEYGTMGCPIDPRKSIAWYSKAATKGDIESQLALSGWYLTGSDGVIQQSDTEAYLWARKAAEKGLAKAEYALGYFTEVGIGVPQNLDEAKRWYYKAANQQHPKAQLRLQELKKGGASAQRGRERLSRSNVRDKDNADCVIM